MNISKSQIPAASALHQMYPQAYYWDAHEVPLHEADMPVHKIYLEIFSHYPVWAKVALTARGRLGKLFGVKGPAFADLEDSEWRDTYRIGEKIGRFTLLYQSEYEIITGENDRHLDFRVSVMKMQNGKTGTVILSTIVQPRNIFGKIYLLLIEPFHRFGIKTLLSSAAGSKRI
jgi:hypothetical protein